MTILTYPNDHLRIKCKSIEKVTPELQEVAKEMYKTMIINGGVGLSAPQVGLDIRLFVLDNQGAPMYFFNPILIERSKDVRVETEGCLSFPSDFRRIKRSKQVKVKYRDINNKMQYTTLNGILAVAFQHELNHLDGVLFIDHENIS